jgi:hypothetical protein
MAPHCGERADERYRAVRMKAELKDESSDVRGK